MNGRVVSKRTQRVNKLFSRGRGAGAPLAWQFWISTIYNYCKIGTLGYRCIKNSKKYTWQIDLESLELLEKDSSFRSSLQVKKSLQYNLF